MTQVLVTFLLIAGLVLFIVSPFAALGSLMLLLLVTSLFWGFSTLVAAFLSSDTKKEDLS